jgi:hypothetical protein
MRRKIIKVALIVAMAAGCLGTVAAAPAFASPGGVCLPGQQCG